VERNGCSLEVSLCGSMQDSCISKVYSINQRVTGIFVWKIGEDIEGNDCAVIEVLPWQSGKEAKHNEGTPQERYPVPQEWFRHRTFRRIPV